jgi:hypothetical protein
LSFIANNCTGYSKNWLPICWAASICCRARIDGRIKDDFALKTIIEELNRFRSQCGTLMNYAVVCIPLVYVQVVTIAVYTYFLTMLIAKQPVQETNKELTLFDHFPFLISLQFMFYMGWLKVAETMINPFGDDDDDFDVNNMIDRNLILSYLIVDEMHNDHPELLKDQYWDETPSTLPDRGRQMKDVNKTDKITDFFDVHQDEVKTAAGGQDDLEALSTVLSRAGQKPRSSVIDENYKSARITESSMDNQLQKARERQLSRQLESDSSSSEHISDLLRPSSSLHV